MSGLAYSPPPSPLVRAPEKTITFTGASGLGAAGENVTVYTITGRIMLVWFPAPFCTTNLGEAAPTATVSLGVTGAVTCFLSATSSTAIDANEWWSVPASPPTGVAEPMQSSVDNILLIPGTAISQDIIIACATQNTNSGVLVFQGIYYIPLTAGASLA